jgi:hypothetical protein
MYLNEKDGFSVLGALLFQFAEGRPGGGADARELGDYTKDDAKTVLLDAETGERVPHFVELDRRTMDASQSLLSIYPVTPLRHGRRYVVGIRGLVRGDGSAVAASPGFEALRGCGDDGPGRARAAGSL